MGFFSHIFKKAKKFALPAIGALIAPGIGAGLGSALSAGTLASIGGAVGSGLSSYTTNHNPLGALLSAGGSFAGGQLGSSLFPGTVGGTFSGAGNVGPSFINPGVGSVIGQSASNAIGAQLANTSIGSLIGSNLGSDLGESFAGNSAEGSKLPAAPAGPAPFQPKQEAEQDLPAGLTGFASLTPEQRSTNLATQGTYGGGLGPQEQEYYVNQAQRRLVDPAGKVGDPSSVFKPIELSYLKRLGLGGTSGLNLAELISQWNPA